jgi:hypothetical protein
MRLSTSFVATLASLAAVTACGDDPSSGGVDAHIDQPVADAPVAPTPVEFGNVARTCTPDNAVSPVLPGEAGHYAATSLTPPSYPFTVDKVSYSLQMNGSNCHGGLAHRVLVFTASGEPAAAPSAGAMASIDVPAGADADRWVDLTLPNPITLTSGQTLVVAVQMASDGADRSVCLSACPGSAAGHDWWSNAAAEPYAWADMFADFGFTSAYVIVAEGTPGA